MVFSFSFVFSVPVVSLASSRFFRQFNCSLRRSFSLRMEAISRRISSSCSASATSVPTAVLQVNMNIAALVIAVARRISLTNVPLILFEHVALLSTRSMTSSTWACISEVGAMRSSRISSSSVPSSLASFFLATVSVGRVAGSQRSFSRCSSSSCAFFTSLASFRW